MATIKDVAQRAGVSPSTVSKFINGGHVRNENVDAIRDAIRDLDYRVNPFARNLKTQSSRSIGILLPELAAPFYGTVINSLDRILREHGYHSLISCYNSNHGLERDNLRFLVTNGIAGLIYAPGDLSADEFYELTATFSIPVVQFDRIIPGIPADAVLADNSGAAYQVVSHLIAQGHRRIAMVIGSKSVYSFKERLVGYLRALSSYGIRYDDALVVGGREDFATGYTGFQKLMKLRERPTAVFCANYDITIGLVTAARERGIRIPEELTIFGFDCADICNMMHPPLPVVHQPEKRIGQCAANLMVERLEGYTGEARVVRLECSLSMEKNHI